MRLRSEQLADSLAGDLAPIYLVFGDETLLVEESCDMIRQQARQLGIDHRQVWHVEGRFNWGQIEWQQQTMSLFASSRLLEIRLPSGVPGKEGSEALRQYAAKLAADTTLLIISGKIDSRTQKSKWFTELDKVGVTIAIRAIDLAHLPRWILQRMQQKVLPTNQQIAELIAQRVQGNLFAAAQEIAKLALICPQGQLDEATVLAAVADNARFDVFALIDSTFLGQAAKIPRIINRLRAEGIDILSLLAALSWSLHRVMNMAIQLAQGAQLEQLFAAQKPPIWDRTKPMLRQVLNRHQLPQWLDFLQQLATIDQAAKGSFPACPWSLLESLCLHVAGINVVQQELV